MKLLENMEMRHPDSFGTEGVRINSGRLKSPAIDVRGDVNRPSKRHHQRAELFL